MKIKFKIEASVRREVSADAKGMLTLHFKAAGAHLNKSFCYLDLQRNECRCYDLLLED